MRKINLWLFSLLVLLSLNAVHAESDILIENFTDRSRFVKLVFSNSQRYEVHTYIIEERLFVKYLYNKMNISDGNFSDFMSTQYVEYMTHHGREVIDVDWPILFKVLEKEHGTLDAAEQFVKSNVCDVTPKFSDYGLQNERELISKYFTLDTSRMIGTAKPVLPDKYEKIPNPYNACFISMLIDLGYTVWLSGELSPILMIEKR